MPKSNLGRENTLPRYKILSYEEPVEFHESPGGIRMENTMEEFGRNTLPYLLQDHYDHEQNEGEMKTVVLENEFLKATFYPEYGGRLASLWDKEENKELLFDNPAFQPANLALRNAWFSGGIEWNGPAFGHTFITCNPVHFGVHEKDGTKILRIYDFDRYYNTSWQIDFKLEDGSKQLWYHVTLRNLSETKIPLFWWTNIAAPVNEKIRFITRHDHCLNHLLVKEMSECSFPVEKEIDISYSTNSDSALSLFFIDDKKAYPWFSYADEKGYGLFHLSSKNLPGKKLWYFGSSNGGKNWMDKLSMPGQGDYIEIQAGVTDTQVQMHPFPEKSVMCWTECIGPLSCDQEIIHGDYTEAVNHSEEKIESLGISNDLEKIHEMMVSWQDDQVDEVIYHGLGWGKVYELSYQTNIPGATFSKELGEKEQPWFELLTNGTFSEATLNKEPISWMVDSKWIGILQKSVKDSGDTWLHSLYLGVIFLENEEEEEAIKYFEKSSELKINVHAFRSLATIYLCKKEYEKAQDYYKKAWEIANESEDLYLEILNEYINRERFESMVEYMNLCPAHLKEHELLSIGKSIVAINEKKYPEAREALLREYTFIREGNTILSDLWFESYIGERSLELGRDLTDEEKKTIETEFAPPKYIDFRLRR